MRAASNGLMAATASTNQASAQALRVCTHRRRLPIVIIFVLIPVALLNYAALHWPNRENPNQLSSGPRRVLTGLQKGGKHSKGTTKRSQVTTEEEGDGEAEDATTTAGVDDSTEQKEVQRALALVAEVSHAQANDYFSSPQCLQAARSAADQYAQHAQKGHTLRKEHGPLVIAAFSRLWVPPIHGSGGMQFHALHLYSQFAAYGHQVHVFLSASPHRSMDVATGEYERSGTKGHSSGAPLKYYVDPTTLALVDWKDYLQQQGIDERSEEGNPALAPLTLYQIPSATNAEYSEEWYENCLTAARKINGTLKRREMIAGGGKSSSSSKRAVGWLPPAPVSGMSPEEATKLRKKSYEGTAISATHFHVAHSESWAGVPNAYLLGLPMAVTWHGSMLDWFRNEINLIVHNYRIKGKMPGDHKIGRMKALGGSVGYEAFALLTVPHHVVISDSAANDLKTLNLIEKDRIHLIYNGVNPTNFHPFGASSAPSSEDSTNNKKAGGGPAKKKWTGEAKAARLAYLKSVGVNVKPDEEIFVMGCGGRLEDIKGHHQLSLAMDIFLNPTAAATAKAATKKPIRSVLLVTGHGGESERYERLKSKGYPVVMIGMVPQGALADFYRSLDVFIDPYYQHHGLNTVMLEAGLSGVPIVATQLASTETTVPCSGYGRRFGLGLVEDLVEQLTEMRDNLSEQDRAAIGQEQRDRSVKLFTSAVMAGQYQALLYEAWLDPKPLIPVKGKVVCKKTYPAMCYREP